MEVAPEFKVDTISMTCTCCYWQQTGIPCQHAVAVFTLWNMPATELFSTKCFSATHLTSNWRKMYQESPDLVGMIPTEDEVKCFKVREENSAVQLTQPALVAVDNFASSTMLRIRSRGERKRAGTTSVTQVKTPKIICRNCGKIISRKTRHKPSACTKYKLRTATLSQESPHFTTGQEEPFTACLPDSMMH
jgi:hypothetical protein